MSKTERLFSIIGVLLLGLSAYLVASERQRMEEARNEQAPPPVEELSEKLKEAWAGHHTP